MLLVRGLLLPSASACGSVSVEFVFVDCSSFKDVCYMFACEVLYDCL
jgi:hypothetical protein